MFINNSVQKSHTCYCNTFCEISPTKSLDKQDIISGSLVRQKSSTFPYRLIQLPIKRSGDFSLPELPIYMHVDYCF